MFKVLQRHHIHLVLRTTQWQRYCYYSHCIGERSAGTERLSHSIEVPQLVGLGFRSQISDSVLVSCEMFRPFAPVFGALQNRSPVSLLLTHVQETALVLAALSALYPFSTDSQHGARQLSGPVFYSEHGQWVIQNILRKALTTSG